MIGVKVDITSRKIIKPASPTPPHLKTFKLSLLDQLIPPFHGTLIFFYPSSQNNHNSNTSQRSHCLQNSLSKTLVHFYPLAGQLNDASTIECNDEGAYFVEARINCQLVDLLSQPDPVLLSHFIPTTDHQSTQLASLGFILLVQLTIFKCGGIAIAVCPSHKIADAASICTFLRSWTSNNCEFGEPLPPPEFIGASLLPSRDISTALTMQVPATKCVTKRFMFYASKIASLKAKVGIGQHHPTSVALVLSLILKSAIAASQSKSGSLRPSVLFQFVNLRRKMVPPLPDNCIGNLAWMFPLVFKETHMELHDMVAKMRKGLVDFRNEKLSRFKGDEGFLAVCESIKEREEIFNTIEINSTYRCTSLCGFPLYEVDFGWGKPMWVTNPSRSKNLIILLDAKCGDAIEGWITLDEQEMAIFERDEELLAFASFDGSACVNYCRM